MDISHWFGKMSFVELLAVQEELEKALSNSSGNPFFAHLDELKASGRSDDSYAGHLKRWWNDRDDCDALGEDDAWRIVKAWGTIRRNSVLLEMEKLCQTLPAQAGHHRSFEKEAKEWLNSRTYDVSANRINAIKELRAWWAACTGLAPGLKETKDIVVEWCEEHP